MSWWNGLSDKIKTVEETVQINFAVHALGHFAISCDQNQENGCLENYICVRAFKHGPVPIDQVFCTPLQALPVAVLAIPVNSAARENHAKSAKHTVDYLSHVFFQTCTRAFNTNAKMCLKGFVQRDSMTSGKKFTFDVFTIAENVWFLIICTNKQWWIAK